ncbi:MAG: hypothetical protein WAT39_16550, partial [Planctomycetota bacterium]
AVLTLRRSPAPSKGHAVTPLPGAAADGIDPPGQDHAEPHAGPEDPAGPPPRRPASLQGELRAILVLYACLCGLPLVVGAWRG